MRPPTSPIARFSGSGPLSSLRPSRFDSEWFELKKSGFASCVMRSKSEPESKTCSPAVFHTEKPRPPKVYSSA